MSTSSTDKGIYVRITYTFTTDEVHKSKPIWPFVDTRDELNPWIWATFFADHPTPETVTYGELLDIVIRELTKIRSSLTEAEAAVTMVRP